VLLPPEKLMLVPEDVPKVAVPVGTFVGFQLALVLKSKLPSGLVTFGAVDQVASWAKAGVTPNSVPTPMAANAADTRALRMTLPTQRPPALIEIAAAPSASLLVSPTPVPHAFRRLPAGSNFFRPDDFRTGSQFTRPCTP